VGKSGQREEIAALAPVAPVDLAAAEQNRLDPHEHGERPKDEPLEPVRVGDGAMGLHARQYRANPSRSD